MRLPSLAFGPQRLAWLLGAVHGPRARWGFLALLLSAMAVLALAGWQAWAARSLLAQRMQQAAAGPARPRPAEAPAHGGPVLGANERRGVNLVIRRLNTPWGAIFDALERESSPDVTVLAVETDAERGAIRIHTEGRKLDRLLEHAGRIQQDPNFAHAHLLRIDANEAGPEPLARLGFDLVLAR